MLNRAWAGTAGGKSKESAAESLIKKTAFPANKNH